MFHPPVSRRSTAALALLAAVLIAAPLQAQQAAQAPPMEPQVVLSPQASEALEQALAGTTHDDMALMFRPYFFPSMSGGTLAMVGFRVGADGLTYGVDPFAAIATEPPRP